MTSHVKHIIWAVALLAGLISFLVIRGKYDAYIADRMAKRDETIAANQVKVVDSQKVVQSAEKANQAIDVQTRAQIADLQRQLAAKPDSATIRAIIESAVPGVKPVSSSDASGNAILSIPDTQANRDAINQAVVGKRVCDAQLGDCQAKQENYVKQIGALTMETTTMQSTIDLQAKDIKQLARNQVPRWTLLAGVGKTQGTTFQSTQSYQPLIGIDYRLAGRFGIGGLAQNKSAAVFLSWRFGSVK